MNVIKWSKFIFLCIVFFFALYYIWIYSIHVRYEAFKTGNYDCVLAPDAYTCMLYVGAYDD